MYVCVWIMCVRCGVCKNTSLNEPRVPFITRACAHGWVGRMIGSGSGERGKGRGGNGQSRGSPLLLCTRRVNMTNGARVWHD